MQFKTLLIIVFALLFVGVTKLNAQYIDDGQTGFHRVFYGGNIGMNFGSITYIDLSPDIGYRLTNRLSMGLGGTYIFYKNRAYNYVFNIWGLRQFTSFTIIKDFSNILPFFGDAGSFLIYGELNAMRIESKFYAPNENGKYWVFSPLLGPAYQIRVGAHSYLLFMVLYNFNESSRSPLKNPVLRMSFHF